MDLNGGSHYSMGRRTFSAMEALMSIQRPAHNKSSGS